MQRPSYCLRCTLPFTIFIESFISFDSSLHKMFGSLLGPISFDNLEGLLIHKQASFPIIFGGIGFISTSIIAPTTCLGNWAFVASVITARFIVDQHPFLFEALVRVNKNTFPFQQHCKTSCDLLPPPIHGCLPPFEQLIGQQMVQLQDSIS